MMNMGNDDCSLICAVEHPEENWHHVLNEEGEAIGDLVVDDLDYLKSYEFYWLERNTSTGNYLWFQEEVSEPSVSEYLKRKKSYHAGKRSSQSVKRLERLVLFTNESNRVFKSWNDCFFDLAHHVAFIHLGGWETCSDNDDWGVCRRTSKLLPFRLFCEPHVLQVIRSQKNCIMDIDHNSFTFGKVYDLGLMKELVRKFGSIE